MEKNQNIVSTWFVWHFYEMPKFLLQAWLNYMSFAANFFSFTQLLKTFFAPWRKYKWRYPRGIDIKEFLNTFISNTFSRIVGAFMRVILIVAGFALQIFVAVAGLAIFLAWIFLPFIIIFGIFIWALI